MLLKIILVPSFLLMVSVVGRLWGPTLAGLLAGLPVVAGPVLYLFALEHGAAFASKAATVSLGGVLTLVVFGAAYAQASRRHPLVSSLAIAMFAWAASAVALSCLPVDPLLSLVVAIATLASASQTADMQSQHQLLNEVAKLVDEGVVRSTVAQTLGSIYAATLKRAHALIESGTSRGKLVLAGF